MKALKCPVWLYIPGITIAIIAISCEKEDTGSVPVLTTTAVTEITGNSAKSGGNITDDRGDEIISRGVVWSNAENPTVDEYYGKTADGEGKGNFTSVLAVLDPGETYFIRAYAENSAGTAYGQQVNFSTTDHWPKDTETQIVDVTNTITGKVWMDRNLGASRAATSSNDKEAWGYLFQWGRAADGHQLRTSETATRSTGHGNFILSPDEPHDWRSPQNNNLWQGVNGINNPCPPGYRLPTEAEWEEERLSWTNKDAVGAFDSPLKLPMGGFRSSNGFIYGTGSHGYYWASTADGTNSQSLVFSISSSGVYSGRRAFGRSVRCIKDE